jgi:hypothetical protein
VATRAKTISPVVTFGDRAHVISWAGLTQATLDDGDPVEMPGSADRSAQVIGVLGVGGSVQIQGSNDGVNWAALTDPQGNNLDMASLKIEAISELTRFVRPKVTAGDGTTNLTVLLLVKRGQ